MKTTIKISYLILSFVGVVLISTSATRIWMGMAYPVSINIGYLDFLLLSIGIALLIGFGIANLVLRKATT